MILWFASVFLLSQLTAALDFQTAVDSDMFKWIDFNQENQTFRLDPRGSVYGGIKPSEAYYFSSTKTNYSDTARYLTFTVDPSPSLQYFKTGLSLLILKNKFVRDNDSKEISVTIRIGSKLIPIGGISQSNALPKPIQGYPENLIFKTWSYEHSDHPEDKRGIEIKFTNLKNLENIYFVVTAYRISKNSSESWLTCGAEGGSVPAWWNCNINKPDDHLLCINYDLACDSLPNCADVNLPNPDENCEFKVGLEEALELLLYTLTVIFVVIILAALVRCLIMYTCGRRSVETAQMVREYLRSGSVDRPLNAPPTYDDAMKEVNEAFEYDETPPVYTPEPQAGEVVCNPFTYPDDTPQRSFSPHQGAEDTVQRGCPCSTSGEQSRDPHSRGYSSRPNPTSNPPTESVPAFRTASPTSLTVGNTVVQINYTHELPENPPPYTAIQ